MAYESIKVDIIPGAENAEVLHFSQYDNKRPFFIELFNGGAEFIPESGMSLTLECRKRDGNIVILSDPVLTDNVAEFSTTEQLTACYGDNTAEIKIVDDNDLVIGSANFIINVEKSPTCGGLVSESEIDNLTQQIAAIVPEVIGEDYYNKAQTDVLLSNKADRSELSALASKVELEHAIEEEDRTLKDWAFTNFATPGYIASRYYNKTEVDNLLDNIFPTLSASGAIASFKTALNKPLVSVAHDTGAITITRCGKNFLASTYKTTTSNNIRYFWNATGGGLLLKANVTYCISVTQGSTHPAAIYVQDYNSGTELKHVYSQRMVTYTPTADIRVRFDVYYANSDLPTEPLSDINCQVEVGSTATDFESYNGQTVPVVDATTLTTLSGVNNIFADSGDVTVQYKYMSI